MSAGLWSAVSCRRQRGAWPATLGACKQRDKGTGAFQKRGARQRGRGWQQHRYERRGLAHHLDAVGHKVIAQPQRDAVQVAAAAATFGRGDDVERCQDRGGVHR